MKLIRAFKSFYLKSQMKHLTGEVNFTDRFGNRLRLDLQQYIDARLYIEGAYEAEIIESVANLMKTKSVTSFIDVGANAGFFSLGVSRLVQPIDLWLFEPDPSTYERLQTNLATNSETFRKKNTIQKALTSESGKTIEFFRSDNPRSFDGKKSNSGTNSVEFNPTRHDSSIKVETATLDEFNLRGPSFIKIDVEGHELEVLKGAVGTLSQGDCWVLVEALGERQMQVSSFMKTLGYQMVKELPGENFIFEPSF